MEEGLVKIKIIFLSPFKFGGFGIGLFNAICKRNTVLAFSYDSFPFDANDIIQTTDYDLILNIIEMISPSSLKKMRNTVLWWMDDPYRWNGRFIYEKDFYTRSFHLIQSKTPIANSTFLPGGADPEIFKPLKKTIKASFIGSKNAEREELLRGTEVQTLGSGWNFTAGISEAASFYGRSRIAVNQHYNEYGTNFRCYEATMAGAMLLTDNVFGLDDLFPEGTIVKYKRGNKEDFVKKLAYYTAHPEEAEDIAEKGRKHCLQHHTMIQRADVLLASL